jgi:hypothetical protein
MDNLWPWSCALSFLTVTKDIRPSLQGLLVPALTAVKLSDYINKGVPVFGLVQVVSSSSTVQHQH